MFQRFSLLLCSFALVMSSSPLAAHASSTPAQKEWTFLVYLNGHNNLDSYGAFNINQMEKVGSTDKINVIVQWASLKNESTQRIFVTKDTNSSEVTSPVIQDLGKVDMGDYRSLTEFIEWGARNFPAKHLFVDVWDHGSGWHAMQAMNNRSGIHATDISWDDNSGNSITTKQLGMAINEAARSIGQKIDIYGSDACLMAMPEVAGEMKSTVNMYVGSEELEPGAGWPYDDILKEWDAKADASPADVAKIVVKNYTKSYMGGQNGNQEVTFSAFDLSKMDQFQASIRTFGQNIAKLDANSRTKVISAFRKAQQFNYDDYRDLGHALDLVEKAKIDAIDRGTLTELKTSLSDFVIANAVTKNYSTSKGLSMWMPGTMSEYKSYVDKYKALQFQSGTDWAGALSGLLQGH